MVPAQSTDLLRRLALAALTGAPVPPDVADWFLDAVARFFSGECYLDEALGLRGPGVPSPQRQAAIVQRDAELAAAYRLADGGDPQASASRRARVLASAIRRTAGGRRLPPDQAALADAIARARSHGVPLPEGVRRLIQVCNETPGY